LIDGLMGQNTFGSDIMDIIRDATEVSIWISIAHNFSIYKKMSAERVSIRIIKNLINSAADDSCARVSIPLRVW
jgi:ATP-dependent protease HslVU (ClpYQ) ATPase subunit